MNEPEEESKKTLGITKAKAKMFEYGIPLEYHVKFDGKPIELLSLAISIIGDYSNKPDIEHSIESKSKLLFVAEYFDSFVRTNILEEYNEYFLLIGATSYYLADMPGSSYVLSNKIVEPTRMISESLLPELLLYLLNAKKAIIQKEISNEIEEKVYRIHELYEGFLSRNANLEELNRTVLELKRFIYDTRSERKLLLVDMIYALIRYKIYNSTWLSLDRYSDLGKEAWRGVTGKPTFITEFWPAQKVLGEQNIYNGDSGIIQMPTSAGKTKSTELIIRSTFISGRSNTVLIIAPFKSLCTEIKMSLITNFENEGVNINEPSDVFQDDFSILLDEEISKSDKTILIVTPEKFMYMMRGSSSLVEGIGLFLFDEGHQFDNGLRGVTYELLLSSLKKLMEETSQVVLISAVISNAQLIGSWLLGENNKVVDGSKLIPAMRTTAFVSWRDDFAKLVFVKNSQNPETDFYIPRLFTNSPLPKKGRETKDRFFPERNDGKSIALFLAIKLNSNGAAAIFCGSKSSVSSICKLAIDLKERSFDFSPLVELSDVSELSKLEYQAAQNFGSSNFITQCCRIGVFSHSSSTPRGIRVAVEHAMQRGKIRLIVCTSTLSQGVNLPIKYLFIPSFYQARDRIKVRDFHNLIGRAGRAGIFTEGSIIFTDPNLYDDKDFGEGEWKWGLAKELLNPDNTEPCESTILSLFAEVKSDDRRRSVPFNMTGFIDFYKDDKVDIGKYAESYVQARFSYENVVLQLSFKLKIISYIESYIMSYDFQDRDEVVELAKETLAYEIAGEGEKIGLIELFTEISDNVNRVVTDSEKRKSYSRTLYGLRNLKIIEDWSSGNIDTILSGTLDELLRVLLSLSLKIVVPNKISKVEPAESRLIMIDEWIAGSSYEVIMEKMKTSGAYIKAKTQKRKLTEDHIIDISENLFSYNFTLIFASLFEILKNSQYENADDKITELETLQKRVKYGLPDAVSIAFYELGFSDRALSIDLSKVSLSFSDNKGILKNQIRTNKPMFVDELSKWPSYFEDVLSRI